MDYPSIADVYRRIGAKDTAECIVLAANVFPFPEPHLKCNDRQEFMFQDTLKIDAVIEELRLEPGEYPKALFDDLDDRIFDEQPSGKVFQYMRRNLAHLPFKK